MEISEKREEFTAMIDNDQSTNFVPEEIVADILLSLHIRPLFRFKIVCKRWNSIISDPKFGRHYMQRAGSSPESSSKWYLWGMLHPYHRPEKSKLSKGRRIVSTLHDIDHAPPSLYTQGKENSFRILASSSGLILSSLMSTYPSATKGIMNYDLYVSNPLTKQFVHLPTLSVPVASQFNSRSGFATLAGQQGCGNPTYVTYKVVFIQRVKRHPHLPDTTNSTIKILSSDNGSWTKCKKMIACPNLIFNAPTLVKGSTSKGILYWFDWESKSIVTYDPYENPHKFGGIKLPSGSGNILSFMNLIHLGHEDVVKYGEIECCSDTGRNLLVWRLVDYDKEEWQLEQRYLISPLLADDVLRLLCRRIVAPDPWNNGDFFCFSVNGIMAITAIVLRSAQEIILDPLNGKSNLLVPIALCPWSSPFYSRVRTRSSSSPIVGFSKISPMWFPSFRN